MGERDKRAAIKRAARMNRARNAEVLEFIHRHPGLGVRGLAAATGRSLTTVQKTVRRLQSAKKIVVSVDGTRWRITPIRRAPVEELPPWVADLLAAVGESAAQMTVIARLPWPRATTQYRLASLVRRGLLERRRGRPTIYAPAAPTR